VEQPSLMTGPRRAKGLNKFARLFNLRRVFFHIVTKEM
jgi:hypothetical protein